MIESILLTIYIIGCVSIAMLAFNDWLSVKEIIVVSIGWPIVMLYAIGNRVFA